MSSHSNDFGMTIQLGTAITFLNERMEYNHFTFLKIPRIRLA